MRSSSEKLTGIRLYMLMVGMLLSGTSNTILMKIQNLTPGLDGIQFNHPFLQCAVMFIGELLCGGVYVAKILYYRK